MKEKYLTAFLDYYKNIKEELISGQDDINKLLCMAKNPLINDRLNELVISNKGGKYIRGTLISLGNYLYGDGSIDYKALAYAYELFETSILIHDDIIDNGMERRSIKTIPYRIYDKYQTSDALTHGNNIALCDGIYGYYAASNIIIDNYGDNKYLKDILHLYNNIVLRTVEGEILDVELPFQNKNDLYLTSEDDVLEIYQKKTAWYTIVGPFLLGMMLTGKEASPKLIDILLNIGIAFQIKDDLLGIFSENLGKSLTDISEYKQTILFTHILETEYKNEFLKYYGTSGNDDIVKELLVKSGSKKYAEDYLDNIYKKTIKDIDTVSDLQTEGKDILKGLLEFIIKREK